MGSVSQERYRELAQGLEKVLYHLNQEPRMRHQTLQSDREGRAASRRETGQHRELC